MMTELQSKNLQRHHEQARDVAQRLLARYKAMTGQAEVIDGTCRALPADGGPACDYCENRRYILDDAGTLKPCPHCGTANGWKAQKLAAYSSRTGRAQEQTFQNFNTAPVGRPDASLTLCLGAAQAFAADLDGWLVIHGKPGNGKSHLCAAVANELIAHGTSVIFVTMPDLLESLKALMDGAGDESTSDRLQTYKTVPVLILDDLGAEKRSEWSEMTLFELVDYRYRNRLPMMIATNLDPNNKDDFDPRVVDRWTDRELSVVVPNNAASWRQREMKS
jgi:DNA replication protein DnaC